MKNKEKNFNYKQLLILTLFFVPIILLTAEGISYLSLRVRNLFDPIGLETQNTKYILVPDVITGSNRIEVAKENFKNKKDYVNKHGLVKTNFKSNNLLDKNIKGILVTGNSVAYGYPLTHEGKYLNTFVNKLEQGLRLKDKKIDVINLSYSSLNSWQENIQLARYFNSEKNHNDLPSNIVLTASIGGIQDFWQFLDLLYMNPEEKNIYYKANGLMSGQSEVLLVKYSKALNGNIYDALELLITNVVRYIQANSSLYKVVRPLTSNFLRVNEDNSENKNFKSEVTEFKEIINNKIKISLNEYENRKKIVIDSVGRNLKSMSALNDNKKMIFIYLPTRFSSIDEDTNLENRYLYKDKLNVSDLNQLEKDYRESLITNLSSIKTLSVFSLASISSYDWFVDESHFSEKGHEKVASKLIPIFQKILD